MELMISKHFGNNYEKLLKASKMIDEWLIREKTFESWKFQDLPLHERVTAELWGQSTFETISPAIAKRWNEKFPGFKKGEKSIKQKKIV